MVTNPMMVVQSENVRLKDENDALRREVHTLRDFVAIINDLSDRASSLKDDAELMPLLNDIFIKALKLLNAPDGSLALLDRDKNELVFVLVLGELSDELTGFRMPAEEGIAGWVIENAQPTLVRDVRRDTRFFANVDEQFKFQTQSVLAAPLIGDGHVLGMIEALNQPGDQPFSELDLALLKLICRIAGEELANIERRPVGDA
jgi:GAF domain-containing protein